MLEYAVTTMRNDVGVSAISGRLREVLSEQPLSMQNYCVGAPSKMAPDLLSTPWLNRVGPGVLDNVMDREN